MDPFQHFLQILKQKNLQQIRKMIVEEPEYVNYQDQGSKRTPIFTVVSCYQDDEAVCLLTLLIDSGANIKHQDINKRTVAFTLCSRGMINCLKMLNSKDEHLFTHKDRLGQTPLFSAVRENQFKLLKQINPNAEIINMTDDIAGHTILFYAAACGYEQICNYLAKKGADLMIIDNCGQSVLSYSSKMQKFHSKAKQRIKKLEFKSKGNQQSDSKGHNHIFGKQAYQLQLFQNNKLKRISQQQTHQLIKQWKQIQRQAYPNQKSYFDCQKIDIDQYGEEYLSNWRHIALKIMNSCLRIKAGKWFLNITKAEQFLSKRQLKRLQGLQLVDINLVKTKLEHNAYRNLQQFANDVAKIWQNCQKINHPNSLIYKYAQELRSHIYKLMLQYNLLD